MTVKRTSWRWLLSVIRQRPVLSYFLLAFAIAWGGVLILALPTGLSAPPEVLGRLYGPVFIAMALGPPLASVVMTGLMQGRKGIAALFGGVLTWRRRIGFYALALLTVPATALAVLGALAAFSPIYMPAVFGPSGGLLLLATGIVIGLAAGFLEELGWTGFAARQLLESHGIVATGILIGVPHGIWHLLVGYYWGDGAGYGLLFIPYFFMAWIVALTALRLLIVWLYARTRSTLVAQMAHASYTGGLVILWPQVTAPAETTLWTSVFALALLAAVSVVLSLGRGRSHIPH